MNVALGITTFQRPAFFKALAKSVYVHLDCPVFVYNDGSASKYDDRYHKAYKFLPDAEVTHAKTNHGVAHAKNHLLAQMLETDADWLILAEDDLKILNKGAVDGYVEACVGSGLHHLSFIHHGDAGKKPPVDTTDLLAFYEDAVGAFCIYSRECLEAVGLFDEFFHNALEHVEHTMRLAEAGFTSGARRFADARWSDKWIVEQEGAIANSSITPGPQHVANIARGMKHWHDANPTTWNKLYGPGTPLEGYGAHFLAMA